jgi:glyoxylase-like metal-dependent hydrolase (beta-lactamase superfamily II)
VRVVAAGNPGPLTGPGTNSYVVGRERIAIVDPGPADKGHLRSLVEAAGSGRITHILLTHRHADHSGGAAALARTTGAQVLDSGTLGDGWLVEDAEWRIEAVATPGHTRDHFCFALRDAEALFSGDHVMGWSSSMIAWPDGQIGDYLASLDRLLQRPERLYLPGHGAPIADGKARVRDLIDHRKSRETAILARLMAGDSSVGAIVEAVYPPLEPRLFQAAEMSVLAHLEDLVERGLAAREGPAGPRGHFSAVRTPA